MDRRDRLRFRSGDKSVIKMVQQVLDRSKNVREAARELGIGKTTLYYWIKSGIVR